MRSIEQLTEEILSLPSASRAIPADKLVESLEFDTDSAIQSIWVTEAKKRRNEVRDGSVKQFQENRRWLKLDVRSSREVCLSS